MKQECIRAFIAAELDAQSWKALGSIHEALCFSKLSGLRILPLKNIHLTLRFLGNINPSMVISITESLSQIAKMVEPFALTFDRFGAFPNMKQPKVLWFGPQSKSFLIEDLQQKLEDPLYRLGLQREQRQFTPHLTFARIKSRSSTEEIFDIRKAIEKLTVRSVNLQIHGISLVRSDLGPRDATYTQLYSAQLQR